jgi:hypothetical protein
MEINSKWTKDLCIRPESINLLKIGKFHDMGLSNVVWMCRREEGQIKKTGCVLTRQGRDCKVER